VVRRLGQFFRTVRTFNAHRAEVSKQLELLELFGHLDPNWRASLERAVAILRRDRQLQVQGAGSYITDLIVEAINYRVEQAVPDGLPLEPVQKLLFERYKAHLVGRERQCRQRVEEVYYYSRLERAEQDLTLEESDLFNIEQWYLWGLSEKSLLLAAASAGALVGGTTGIAVDAASGGLLGGLGTLISGAGGAVSGLWGVRKYAGKIGQMKVKGIPSGGQLVSYGPSRNINFPFVLLGRALLHQRLVRSRTHADRNALDLRQPLLEWLGDGERKRLARMFDDIRNDRKCVERRTELGEMISRWCDDAASS
jgi:hypothetical protein